MNRIDKGERIVCAIVYIALGILLIVKRGAIAQIAVELAGAALIISAVFEFIAGRVKPGLVKLAVGLLLAIFGAAFSAFAMKVLAIGLIVSGIVDFWATYTSSVISGDKKSAVARYAPSVFYVLSGAVLFASGDNILSVAVLICGVCLIINGTARLFR